MKYVLYIQDDGVYLFKDKSKNDSPECFFEWVRKDALKKALQKIKKSERLYLILDVVDEDITFEWKPKLFPWEKAQYLKLENVRVAREGAFLQRLQWTGVNRKQDNQRKEELLSKSIVYQNQDLEDLLQQIETLELKLSGIYSVSYVIDRWFYKVALPHMHLSKKELKLPFFLLVRLSKYRFRQLFYFNGLLRISRDFIIDEQLEMEAAIQSRVMNESQAVLKYLYNQKIVAFNAPVSMVLVDIHRKQTETSASWKLFFEEHYLNKFWEKSSWFFMILDFPTLMKKKHKNLMLLDGQSVFANFILKYYFPTFYAHDYLKQVASFALMTRTVHGGIFMTIVSIIFYSVYQGVTLYFLQQKRDLYQQQIVAFQAEKLHLQKMVNLVYDAKDLKASVEFSQALLELKKGNNSGLNWLPIMKVLDKSDHILIENLHWRVEERIDDNHFVVEMQGWVFPFEETYHLPTQWVDQFVQDLKAVSNVVEVQLVQEPLNRDLSKALSVSNSNSEVQALPFQVTLKVKRNDKP